MPLEFNVLITVIASSSFSPAMKRDAILQANDQPVIIFLAQAALDRDMKKERNIDVHPCGYYRLVLLILT
jgi:hypothetical protein